MSKNVLKVKISQYTFDVEYHRNTSNCKCDGICRCSTLEDVKIASKPRISDFMFEYKKSNSKSLHKFTEIEEYCIERILTFYKYYDVSNYEVEICNSYYGQEVCGISFDNMSRVESNVKEMLGKNSPLSQIMYVLNLEYSFIPKNLQDVNIMEIDEVSIEDIEYGNGQLQLIKRNNDDIYETSCEIRGILLLAFGKYNLVDGHHRLQYDISTSNKTNKYIVLK